MEADELIKKLQEEGYLITPDALRIIKESKNPDELIHGVLQSLGEELIIGAEHLEKKEKSKISSIHSLTQVSSDVLCHHEEIYLILCDRNLLLSITLRRWSYLPA